MQVSGSSNTIQKSFSELLFHKSIFFVFQSDFHFSLDSTQLNSTQLNSLTHLRTSTRRFASQLPSLDDMIKDHNHKRKYFNYLLSYFKTKKSLKELFLALPSIRFPLCFFFSFVFLFRLLVYTV
jgi:hypothetical protein